MPRVLQEAREDSTKADQKAMGQYGSVELQETASKNQVQRYFLDVEVNVGSNTDVGTLPSGKIFRSDGF